jgi:hypothetical protein
MVMRSVRRLALLLAVAVMLVAPTSGASANQGSYDAVRVQLEDGSSVLYRVWLIWPQLLLTTPDGGGWGFFTAQAGTVDAPYKLFVARFDPVSAKWSGATAVPGGQIQFGPAGVVDANGVAHVVFTDRAADDPAQFGRVMYMRTTPEGGWTPPVAINENANAGHQLAPAIAADAQGGVHVVWQDQRVVSPEARAASPANASIIGCDLTPEGACAAEPIAVSVAATATEIGNRPRLSTDGQRLIATWSNYASSTEADLSSATQIAWSSRPLGDPAATWSAPQTLVDRGDSAIGGRLFDVTSDPTGGVVAVFGRRTDITSLYMTRIAAGQDTWSDPMLLGAGNRGSYPSVAVGGDGTVYVAYNIGAGDAVSVAGLMVQPGATGPSREVEISVAEFGRRGQPVLSVDNQGRVWTLYIFEPLYIGDLDASQVPNEIHVLRGTTFSSEPAPEAQLVPPTPAPASSPVAEQPQTPAPTDGTGQPEVIGTPSS